jgi:zinc protease
MSVAPERRGRPGRRGWRRLTLALAPLLAAASGSGTAAGAAPGPAAPAALMGPALATRVVLPNGLVLLVAERPALAIVTVKVEVAAGATADPADRAGLANLTALLLTRGTPGRTGAELDRAIEFVGGSLEGEGGRDASALSLAVLKKDFGLGLDLLAAALRRPSFPPDEFARKREEVQAAVRQGEEDPGEVADQLLRRLVFPGDPYGRPVVGTDASLARMTRADCVRFHARHYRPDRTVVAVVGDVTAEEARAAVTARLGDWRGSGSPAPVPRPAPVAGVARTETVPRELTQATVLLGQATIARQDPDYYPLLLAAYVLGGSSSSRLYARVREERGLAYAIDAELAPALRGGLFVVAFQSRTARVKEVLGLVREELGRLRREPVSEEELDQAKAYLVGSFPLRMDTNAAMGTLLLRIERFGLGLDYPTRYRQAVQAVTAADLLRAVRRHWDPAKMSLALVGNAREAGLRAS